jgi:hypothetical protein
MSQPERIIECLRSDYKRRPDEEVITQKGVLEKSWATILRFVDGDKSPGEEVSGIWNR